MTRPSSHNLLDLAPPDIMVPGALGPHPDPDRVVRAARRAPAAGHRHDHRAEVSRRAAEKADVPYAPPFWAGYSPQHLRDTESSVGTITLRASTFNEVLFDIARSLIHHGWNKLVFVNGHGSNTKVHRPAAAPHQVRDGRVRRALQAVRRALHRDPRRAAREPAGRDAGLARVRAGDVAGDGARPVAGEDGARRRGPRAGARLAAGLVHQEGRRARTSSSRATSTSSSRWTTASSRARA